MFHFGVRPPTGGVPKNEEFPEIIPCERCGFLCDTMHDAVCPSCEITKRENNYRAVKAN